MRRSFARQGTVGARGPAGGGSVAMATGSQGNGGRDPEGGGNVWTPGQEHGGRYGHGGIVEKFIGDAVVAVWDAPVAEEGDTERAVRAALELVSAVDGLGAEVSVPDLAARAGVVTGEVAVMIGAAGEGMLAGDAVNAASRVLPVARPGSVLCDEAPSGWRRAPSPSRTAGSTSSRGRSARSSSTAPCECSPRSAASNAREVSKSPSSDATAGCGR